MGQTGFNGAMLPYILLLLHLWAAASSEQACEVVTHFPTLARGLAWETHCTVVFCSQSHICRVSDCPMLTKNAFSLPQQSNVPVLMHLYKTVVGYLMFSCMLQNLPLTTAVNQPCDMKALVCHHFQFYTIDLLHTIGSLMILESMQARGKRLSVQECKFSK